VVNSIGGEKLDGGEVLWMTKKLANGFVVGGG
jgi:hypothetical protein